MYAIIPGENKNMCSKLQQLTHDYGFGEPSDMVEIAIMDGVCPGICMNEGCSYSTDVEPDQDHGYCEICCTQSVVSALVIMGLI